MRAKNGCLSFSQCGFPRRSSAVKAWAFRKIQVFTFGSVDSVIMLRVIKQRFFTGSTRRHLWFMVFVATLPPQYEIVSHTSRWAACGARWEQCTTLLTARHALRPARRPPESHITRIRLRKQLKNTQDSKTTRRSALLASPVHVACVPLVFPGEDPLAIFAFDSHGRPRSRGELAALAPSHGHCG